MKLTVFVADLRRSLNEWRFKKALSKMNKAYDRLYGYDVKPDIYKLIYRQHKIDGVNYMPPFINE